MSSEWPLVGRTAELRSLRFLVTSDKHRGAVLAGPAGVGKTRIALECLRLAEQVGLVTVRVAGTRSASRLPFGALAPLLPADDRGGASADSRADLLRRCAAALVARAGERRLVLLVDDAHLLDDASATLVHQLATDGVVSILATVRTGESAPDPVLALWKDGLLDRVDLTGLAADAVEELLAAALGGPVDPSTANEFATRAQGNVLFLRELVVGALSDGTLSDDLGLWRLVGALSPSYRLVELIDDRLGRLSSKERGLLELVAFADSLGRAELECLTNPALVEALERKGLLVSRVDGRRLEVRLSHPLYGDVVRSRIPLVRVPAIARSLAEAVEATGARRREDTLRIATWRLDGGGAKPELMLAAAATARWRYDFPLAERLAGTALAIERSFDAALFAAELSRLQGREADAEAQLAALAEETTDDTQRARVAVTRMDNALWLGRVHDVVRIADQAQDAIDESNWQGEIRDEIEAKRACALLAIAGPRAAADAMRPLLERAEGGALAWACLISAVSLGRLGRVELAVDAAIRGYAAQQALDRPIEWHPGMQTFFRCNALAYAGRLHEAEELARIEYRQALVDRSSEAQALFACHLGSVVGIRGHLQDAIPHLREALALSRQLGFHQLEWETLVYLALAQALSGQLKEATRLLALVDDADRSPAFYFADIDLLQAKAWTAVAGGDLATAKGFLLEAAARGDQIGDLVGQANALHALARLGDAKKVQARLTDLAGEIEGPLIRAQAAHAQALAASDPDALIAAASEFERLGADLLAAEAAADAAVAWREAGEARNAMVAERRADALVERCDGPETPALQAVASRARLTPAERETALLAANGRSNKQVADELFLSVRTVENRLQRIYEKLGISGRAELAEVLHNPRDSS